MRYKQLTVLSLFIFMMCFGTAAAANSQGLEWGVEITDRFDYTLTYLQQVESNPSGTWDIYVLILELPTLPDTVTSFPGLNGASDGTPFYFANGTLIYSIIPWSFLPIGNWTLVNELFTSQIHTSGDTITDTATEWGYNHEVSMGGQTTSTEIRYSKTDGIMNIYDYSTSDSEGEVVASITLVRDGYFGGGSLGIDPMILLLIGGAVVVVVVVVVVLKKR